MKTVHAVLEPSMQPVHRFSSILRYNMQLLQLLLKDNIAIIAEGQLVHDSFHLDLQFI